MTMTNPYANSGAQWGRVAGQIGNPWPAGANAFAATDTTLRNPAVQNYITQQYLPFYEGGTQKAVGENLRNMAMAGTQARGGGVAGGSNAQANAYAQANNDLIKSRYDLMGKGQQDIGQQFRYEDTRGTQRYQDQSQNYWRALQAQDAANNRAAAWQSEQQNLAYQRAMQQKAQADAWNGNADQMYQQQADWYNRNEASNAQRMQQSLVPAKLNQAHANLQMGSGGVGDQAYIMEMLKKGVYR